MSRLASRVISKKFSGAKPPKSVSTPMRSVVERFLGKKIEPPAEKPQKSQRKRLLRRVRLNTVLGG